MTHAHFLLRPLFGSLLLSLACFGGVGCAAENGPGDATSEDELSATAAQLVADGYVFVSRHVYPAPTCKWSGICIPAKAGASKLSLSRYEHPDGRVAFASSEGTYGPVRRGAYLKRGAWFGGNDIHHGRALLNVREFEVTPTTRTMTVDITFAKDDLAEHERARLPAGAVDGGGVVTLKGIRLAQSETMPHFSAPGSLTSVGLRGDGLVDRASLWPTSDDSFLEQISPDEARTQPPPVRAPLATVPSDVWLLLRAPEVSPGRWALAGNTGGLCASGGSHVELLGAVAKPCAPSEPSCSTSEHRRIFVQAAIGGAEPVELGADHVAPFTSNIHYEAVVYSNGPWSDGRDWLAVEAWGRPVAGRTEGRNFGAPAFHYPGSAAACGPKLVP